MNMQRITLIVGIDKDAHGKQISAAGALRALVQLRIELAQQAGGYTEAATTGGWRHEGHLITEPGRKFEMVMEVHGSCLQVQFDKQRVLDGRWAVVASDVVLVSSVITPAAAAAMLKDDLPLHPADKMEVAASLARIFARNNPAFDAHEFYRLADL